ncbi:MAG TPA: DUF1127 domain-containing protein [Pseudolabrys sp.]|jgi:uncharacterized protein YjiS (DUF1127 family)|nr:DUF1127 domain-containing protein [Pseudolabrys sp.]
MSAKIPVLPIAGAISARAFLSLLAFVTRWLGGLARARRHRREAMTLAGLDRNILADIGLNRSDLRDAFSTPFWEDPTLLLRERAIERRVNRAMQTAPADAAFRRPRTDRPSRHAI